MAISLLEVSLYFLENVDVDESSLEAKHSLDDVSWKAGENLIPIPKENDYFSSKDFPFANPEPEPHKNHYTKSIFDVTTGFKRSAPQISCSVYLLFV